MTLLNEWNQYMVLRMVIRASGAKSNKIKLQNSSFKQESDVFGYDCNDEF